MRLAIISDVHSNLEALEGTLQEIKQRKVDAVIVLGDIVGYGADPNACIELCRELTSYIITGNHDYAVIHSEETQYFNNYAAKAVHWTATNITEENSDFLNSLPMLIPWENYLFVHSAPLKPAEWEYIMNQWDAEPQFAGFSQKICFIGHTHVPVIFRKNNRAIASYGGIELPLHEQLIINVGSVGQPRDGNHKLSFAIFDDQQWQLEVVRLNYDIEKAARKIVNAGLPSALAERLFYGF